MLLPASDTAKAAVTAAVHGGQRVLTDTATVAARRHGAQRVLTETATIAARRHGELLAPLHALVRAAAPAAAGREFLAGPGTRRQELPCGRPGAQIPVAPKRVTP